MPASIWIDLVTQALTDSPSRRGRYRCSSIVAVRPDLPGNGCCVSFDGENFIPVNESLTEVSAQLGSDEASLPMALGTAEPIGYLRIEHEAGESFIERSIIRQVDVQNSGHVIVYAGEDREGGQAFASVNEECRARIIREMQLMSTLLVYSEQPSPGRGP